MKNGATVVLCLLLAAMSVRAADAPAKDVATKDEPSGEYYDWKKTNKPERPWLLRYDQTVVTKLFLAWKGKVQPGKSRLVDGTRVFLTFEQALEVIRKLDNITLGMPKIVYLVGWQHRGHDSKYPDMSVVNPRLKRAQDKTAVESLRWLMREAKKYNTKVSLHINMFDAYDDSPLWKKYDELDILAKDKSGKIILNRTKSGYISHTQEWKLGLAQKRIDGLIEMLPELKASKTIHIDAFFACRPSDTGRFGDPISPFLGYTMAQETATIRKIYRYWRDKGFDVTSEGSSFLRSDALVGLQPMAWWDHPGGMPAKLYCGSPMHVEEEVKHDPDKLAGLLDQFCLMALPWYYRNNDTAVKGNQKMLEPDVGPKRHPHGKLFEQVMAGYGNHVFMPALWKEKTIVAYSRTGYKNKSWVLPPDWKDVTKVSISKITLDGLEKVGHAQVTGGKLTLDVVAREALAITPVDR